LFGRPEWLTELDKLRLPYNVNVLTQTIAAYVLEQHSLLEAQAANIRNERTRLAANLAAQTGIRVYPSNANFILFQVLRADAVFNDLRSRGILIKNLNGSHPRLADCLRVTVGTPTENDQFVAALQQSLLRAA